MAETKPKQKPEAKARKESPKTMKKVAITPPPKTLPQKAKEKASEPKIGEMAPIKAHEFDPHFKYEIGKMHGGEKLKQCFQCGTCTSDCPIARFSDSYRPRAIIRMTQLGLKNRVLSSDTLWLCAACFTCTDRCPQDVEVASVIRILRNAAAEQGLMPSIFKDLGLSILESGIAYRIPELRLKKREQIGLPPLPKGNPEVMMKLAKVTGFSKILGKVSKRDNS
ncbi:MAG: 4Fe-4S dicluster domain-containing protein [Candidatus Bathyarchaeota archaeon]|nr:4Fe-4S dicluster domain-containing protein [Candidatus Bathyarchaeota archaeon]